MADADRDDAGKRIQIPPPHLVPHVLHLAFHDHQRIAVVRDDPRRQILVPQGKNFVAGRTVVRRRLVIANGKRMTQLCGHGNTPGQRLAWLEANHDFTLDFYERLHP